MMWDRWQELVMPFTGDEEKAAVVFVDLGKRYGENGRFYHNLHHIQSVLDHIQPCLRQAKNAITLELAAWFHDVIYIPKRHDNEEQSSLFAHQTLTEMGLAKPEIREVERLILLTSGHETAVSDTDGGILIDADLAILAAEPAQYDAYARAIRQEYAHVPDEAYRAGRVEVLKRLGERPFLYYLPAHRSWETRARDNLGREIARFQLK